MAAVDLRDYWKLSWFQIGPFIVDGQIFKWWRQVDGVWTELHFAVPGAFFREGNPAPQQLTQTQEGVYRSPQEIAVPYSADVRAEDILRCVYSSERAWQGWVDTYWLVRDVDPGIPSNYTLFLTVTKLEGPPAEVTV